MTQHYTRNTVEVEAWCKKCSTFTMHRIDGVKLGPCLTCLAKLKTEHDAEADHTNRAIIDCKMEQMEFPQEVYEDHR